MTNALALDTAIFNGKAIRLLADVPYTEPYRVVVTFVEPVATSAESEPDRSRFWASFGAWQIPLGNSE